MTDHATAQPMKKRARYNALMWVLGAVGVCLRNSITKTKIRQQYRISIKGGSNEATLFIRERPVGKKKAQN